MRNVWDRLREKIAVASSDRSRSRFAETVGVQPNTVKAWVEKKTVPGIDMLEPIAEALGLNLAEFFSGEGTPPAAPAPTPSDELVELMRGLLNATPQQKKAFRAVLNAGNRSAAKAQSGA